MSDDRLGTSNLRFEREGPVAWCVIDRPGACNAITPAMYYGFKQAVRITNGDKELAAQIITGTGDVFAPGGDLGGRRDGVEDDWTRVGADILPFTAIRGSRKPVIAAVNGICRAGGPLIAMMADVAVVSERAVPRGIRVQGRRRRRHEEHHRRGAVRPDEHARRTRPGDGDHVVLGTARPKFIAEAC